MTPQPPDTDEITQEVWRIVGGDFTPDAIGPERYDAQVARVRERPAAYLDAFESMFLGVAFDARLQSELHPEALFKITVEADADRTRAIADQLLRQLDAVMLIRDEAADTEALFSLLPEETANVSRRLEQRRAQLRSLLS
jgi:hypothetical protein